MRLPNLLDCILWFVKIIVMFGFKALKQNTMNVGPIDKIVDSNM
ncbi:MAG: hypothetical protein ACI4AB_07085 [Acetatifactor sp.]